MSARRVPIRAVSRRLGLDRMKTPATNAVQCLVAERRDGHWRIALFQNTPAQCHGRPEATEQHTSELTPQVASETTVA